MGLLSLVSVCGVSFRAIVVNRSRQVSTNQPNVGLTELRLWSVGGPCSLGCKIGQPTLLIRNGVLYSDASEEFPILFSANARAIDAAELLRIEKIVRNADIFTEPIEFGELPEETLPMRRHYLRVVIDGTTFEQSDFDMDPFDGSVPMKQWERFQNLIQTLADIPEVLKDGRPETPYLPQQYELWTEQFSEGEVLFTESVFLWPLPNVEMWQSTEHACRVASRGDGDVLAEVMSDSDALFVSNKKFARVYLRPVFPGETGCRPI
jgi:hypothetical protein